MIYKFLIAIPLIMIGFLMAFNYGLNKSEYAECLKMQAMSVDEDYPNYYITPSENEMCKEVGVIVVAPVKFINRFK